MIGPPGLPKLGRRIFHFATAPRTASRLPLLHSFKWVAGLYVAGVLAHFSHHVVTGLPAGVAPSFGKAIVEAPVSLAWPADLIGTLLASS